MIKLISQGAEAKIYLNSSKNIVKDRIPKSYRHPDLDNKIRTRRTRAEAKILTRCQEAKINVPKILSGIPSIGKMIHMEYIQGERLSQTLNNYPIKSQIQIIKKLATQVSKLHATNIIHADLTTSNVILKKSHRHQPVSQRSGLTAKRSHSEAVYLIDFGLSYISIKLEDKAVDLHLLKQALEAKHHKTANQLFKEFEKSYKWQDAQKVLERLKVVEKRGRYKH